MKKVLAIALALITLTAIFAGCTQTVEPPKAEPPQENVAPAPAPAAGTMPEGASQKIAADATDAEGKLNGWIDGNSVEIQMTPTDAAAFRVTDVLNQMEGIKDGDTVKFSYKVNAQDQLVITKIEKAQ